MKRVLLFSSLVIAAAAVAARQASPIPATPVITEPSFDSETISPYDVHMVAGPFVGAPGENHVCSDWQIQTPYSAVTVWTASCVTGTLKVHIHLGDGTFVGTLAGQHQLIAGVFYKVRVRFKGDQPAPDGSWSDWAERLFYTAPATSIEPLVLSDVSVIPAPRLQDESGDDVILPAGAPAPSLRLEVKGGGTLLEFDAIDGSANGVRNPPALAAHGPLHVVCDAGGAAALAIPASRVSFTDGSGADRAVYLPPISLSAGQSIAFWISESGGAFADAGPPSASPDFTTPMSESPVPWAVKQPGFLIERVATGFQLPVDIAFIPTPAAGPDDPLFYVTELYGSIKLVTRAGDVSDYATSLLNFDPTGPFPGSGEKGLTGIVVEPQSGDLFASMVYALPNVTDFHFPKVVRLHSTDGGRTSASQATILDFPNEPLGPSHQISNLSIGPDGKLYVHIGDGLLTTPAEDLNSVRGKILRVNFDGSAPGDNPFFNAGDGITATDFIFAYGFRNPFGGAWRAADGSHWEVENGPFVDRFAKVVAGRNYLWDGTDESMRNFAAYNWPTTRAPVNVAFVQTSTFGGSGFPVEKMDHAFVTESGPTYAPGPQASGKRISEFAFDLDGNLLAPPVPLVEYIGAGRATAVGLASGPDGLYFTDLYKDFGATLPTERGANVFRIRYTGIADFAADTASGRAPLTVRFQDRSSVPGAVSWHWEFGDGRESDEQHPSHEYELDGAYDVRLTVAGEAGETARQKGAFIVVTPPVRQPVCAGVTPPEPCAAARPAPRVLPPRS